MKVTEERRGGARAESAVIYSKIETLRPNQRHMKKKKKKKKMTSEKNRNKRTDASEDLRPRPLRRPNPLPSDRSTADQS